MRIHGFVFLGVLVLGTGAAAAAPELYPAVDTPLVRTAFVALPLGSIEPKGWLRDQLAIQANGLTGHLDEFWPSVAQSAWRGGDGDAWERGPYYLDGLVPLAYLLKDERLIGKVKGFMEVILASGGPDGWFGPKQNKDRWPLAVALKALTQYHEATGDRRVIPLVTNYFKYLANSPPDWPDAEWRGVRAYETVVSGYWLYSRTRDETVLKAIDSIFPASFDWTRFFLAFPYTDEPIARGIKPNHQTHVVNLAMAIKYPALRFLRAADTAYHDAVYAAIRSLDEHHGQAGGRFGGDEHLCGKKPTQGTELCAVVEYMFSLEKLMEMFGDAAFGDRLELLAYNANPGACTPDYWAHQYDQQANQVLVTAAKRAWSTNGDTSNIYGLEPNYGCCTANMHQGWPKFAAHLWMATRDNGLAAVAYGPCEVAGRVANGVGVTIVEETQYPFEGTIRFTVQPKEPAAFPIYFRIPGWAEGAELRAGADVAAVKAGTFAAMNRTWRPGDVVTLTLPLKVRVETRHNGAAALYRGPLLFALKIGERYEKIASHHETLPSADWAIYPTTSWNYALVLDRSDPEKSLTVVQRKIGPVPFEGKDAPVVLSMKGRVIPSWQIVANSAGDTPQSPVNAVAPAIDIELIPYGCTRLRITEFPVAAR